MPKNKYYAGPTTDHFDGTQFFNPDQPPTDRSLRDILRWRRQSNRAEWPKTVPTQTTKPAQRTETPTVTMVGHASFLLQIAGQNLLLDPVWSTRASPLSFAGPTRVTPPGIPFDDLPRIDAVLLTHNHYDHLDTATLKRLWANHHPRLIAPLGNDAILTRAIPGATVETGDWRDQIVLAPGVTATFHPANHWSARSLRDRRMALWSGYVIEAPGAVIYLAGDTGYGTGDIFRQVNDRFGPPDLAILPIGAYEPRWFMRSQHVNPEEAVQILLDTGATHGLGVHWGTFQLTDEPREAPAEALAEACRQRGLAPNRFVPLNPGDVWTLPAL